MADRFYNIRKYEPSTGSRQLIQVKECNSSGVDLDARGGSALFEFGSIRYIPGESPEGHFYFTNLADGKNSTQFTKDNVKKWAGTAIGGLGVTTTFDLYALIMGELVA